MDDGLLKRLTKLAGKAALPAQGFDTADPEHVEPAAAALLARFHRENDTAAFELLVEISRPLIEEAALAVTRDVGLAVPPSELVAEYFGKLFVDLRQPAPRIDHIVADATASMRDEATRMVRTLARRIQAVEEEGAASTKGAGAKGTKDAAAAEPSPDQALAGRFAALVSMCFHGLDDADRRLLLALEIDRLSYAELGERFGIYQDEVAERVQAARAALAMRIAAVFTALAPEEEDE